MGIHHSFINTYEFGSCLITFSDILFVLFLLLICRDKFAYFFTDHFTDHFFAYFFTDHFILSVQRFLNQLIRFSVQIDLKRSLLSKSVSFFITETFHVSGNVLCPIYTNLLLSHKFVSDFLPQNPAWSFNLSLCPWIIQPAPSHFNVISLTKYFNVFFKLSSLKFSSVDCSLLGCPWTE